MKKVSYLLSLFVLMSLSGCSDDDDKAISGNLVGTWAITELTSESTMTIPGAGSIDTHGEAVGLDGTDTMIFKEDHTCTSSTQGFTMVMTQIIFGQESTHEEEIDALIGDGTWERNGNMLTTTSTANGGEMTYEITELSASTLKLTFDPMADNPGGNESMTMKLFISLERL